MATYSYAQLERLWINAGGGKSLAPLMAAIAMAESGGDSSALNPNDNGGTQSSFGLWQISNGTHNAPSPNWASGPENARLAVAKYKSQGLSAWGTYDSGAYKKYFTGSVPAAANVGGSAGGGGSNVQVTSFVSQAGNSLKAANTLVHDAAVVLDRFFGMFQPGQGSRLIFWGVTIGAGAGAYKSWQSSMTGGEDGGTGTFPLAILLTGVAAGASFMAIRPWPEVHGTPIKAGAYAVDILEGKPPKAGPPPSSQASVSAIQDGLWAILGLWAAAKMARVAQGGSSLISSLGNLLGGLLGLKGAGASGGGGAAPPEVPPIEPVP